MVPQGWYPDPWGEEAHWAAQMMEYLQEEDSESWLVASDAAGDPVGTVAVSSFDPGVATVRISIYRSLTSHGSRAIWLRDLNSPTWCGVTARWSARGAARWPQHRIRP
jgi:RimJ/RimL family protein N-acetyltransferase